MASQLKDIYSPAFYDKFSEVLADVVPSFDKKKFKKLIFDKEWQNRELKERMKHTSRVLHTFLPKQFDEASGMINLIIERLIRNRFTESSLEFMFFPDYIETYGIDHFDTSVKSIEYITQFTSCEFAVRPFIIKYGGKMMSQMYQWSLHENHKVRRLASEGSRPRLPWAMAVPFLKADPALVLPILENLKNDPSEWVRRSVANNLNDIAKDHPDIVIKIAKRWKGISKETDALIKHACRTLLKQAHPSIIKHYGLHNGQNLKVTNFNILNNKLKIGEHLKFSFTLHNNDSKASVARLEYGIFYLRKNGTHSKKVFKISERQLTAKEKLTITRKQSFKLITTRKFYAGKQMLSIIVNGQERQLGSFELVQ
ncbi:MAG TPA: DNA alkylation repair protein [Chitinophagaceae bacterium]